MGVNGSNMYTRLKTACKGGVPGIQAFIVH
jgi:hypothetical protein